MSFIFKYTLFSLQGHICLLQGHKVCTRTRYFNACWLYNDNICSHLRNDIKSAIRIVVVAMTTFSNTQDTVFREILSLDK